MLEESTETPVQSRKSRLNFLKWEAWLALLGGTLAFLYAIQLPARLWQSTLALFSWQWTNAVDSRTPFDGWVAPFPFFPLLAILLWLQGGLTLFWLSERSVQPTLADDKPVAFKSLDVRWLKSSVALLLLGALVVAFVNRASLLLPNSAGRLPASDFDEMVYYQGAALIAQGNLPYRDFFLAHPPLVELIYAAALKLTPVDNAGGFEAFLFLRWWAIAFGLLTVVGIFWAAGRLWAQERGAFASGAGLLAAWLYAADARAAGVATLETPSNFFAVAGFICFLESRRPHHRLTAFLLPLSGALLAGATLCKLPGLAALFAVGLFLLLEKQWWAILRFGAGAVAGFGLILGPVAILGGTGEMLRQLFFFQLLRPQEVAEGKDQIGRLADFPQSSLTVFAAGLALLLLTWQAWRVRRMEARWLLPVLWSAPVIFLLVANKSFHPWYFVQWALPLALLGGGALVWQPRQTWPKIALGGLAALLFLPLFWTQLAEAQRPVFDKVYRPVAAQLPRLPVLTFDPGYTFMAGAPPVRLPATNKYLVDSAGYMVYLNLEIDRRGFGDLLQSALFDKRERGQERLIFEKSQAQAVIAEGLARARWVTLDVKLALAQLTPRTVEFIANAATRSQTVEYVELYQVRPLDLRRAWQLSNGLFVTPLGLSTSLNGQANADKVATGEIITLPAAETATRTLDVRLVWRTGTPPAKPFKVFVHVLDKDNNKVAQRDIAPLDGTADPTRWRSGEAWQDVHSLPLPSLPPGRYAVELGFYEADSGARIALEGQPALTLGFLVIE